MPPISRINPLSVSVGLLAAVLALPLVAIVALSLTGGTGNWQHLLTHVLPRAGGQTLALLTLTCLSSGVAGVGTAYLVSSFAFPLRRALSYALVLPLAIPSYLAAYAYGEFLDYTGPVQTGLRALFGFHSIRDYWFPDIRSLGGAVLVLASVLYPYVYLSARAAFGLQGRLATEAARTLGALPLRVFVAVQLPMARPAIIIGLALVMMETLNDLGAVDYLGVRTLTFAIYETWLNRGDLAGATQIAGLLVLIVAGVIALERRARQEQRFVAGKPSAPMQTPRRMALTGGRALSATLACALPVLLGFAIPVFVLSAYAIRRLDGLFDVRLIKALSHSLSLALPVALLTLVFGFLLAYAQRARPTPLMRAFVKIATLGYGIPGTVLAIGVLLPLARLDNVTDALMRTHLGISSGLLLSGTMVAVIYAHAVRFMTLSEGTLEAGLHKLSPHLDMAARTLGRTRLQTLTGVLLPNLRPAAVTTAGAPAGTARRLKELPATLMLRPFSFNTLSTLAYESASRARVQDAALPALIIIAAGLIPVTLVSRALDQGE